MRLCTERSEILYTEEEVLKLLQIQKDNIHKYVDRCARDIGNSNFTLNFIHDAPLLELKKYQPQKPHDALVEPTGADSIKWINVKDKLPGFCETVLIAYKYLCADKNDDGKDTAMGWYDIKEKTWKRSDSLKMDAVVYWADRPSFPK